jgi:multiple sugar transport system permease protein
LVTTQSTPTTALAKAVKAPRWNYLRDQITAYLFLLPALLIFAVFSWYPIAKTVIYSFQTVSLAKPPVWIGFQNYVRMFGDPLFYVAWRNVFDFIILSLIFGFMAPILLSLMINEMRRLGHIFQVITYLPTLVPIAVALLVWRLIYAPEGGVLNSFLQLVGLRQQLWLQDPRLVKLAMIVIMTWLGAGGSVLIYLSALKEINPQIYEAAEIDGFTFWQRVLYITLPLLQSRMLIMLVLQVIFVGQVFTEPFILTSGGPANSTLTPVLDIYRTAFERSDFGLASTWSVSLMAVLLSFSILYVWLNRKREESGEV